MERLLPWKVHLCCALLALCVLALSGSAATEPLPPRTDYYSGRLRTNIPASHLFLESEFLLTRTLDPAAGLIREQLSLLEPGGICRSFESELMVSGSEFSMPGPEGEAERSGVLGGADWAWDFQRYVSPAAADGLSVEGTLRLEGAGLHRETRIEDASGRILVYIIEDGSQLDEEQYSAILTRWAALSGNISRS
ncbi:hypothetical protein KDL44_04160 [bacterium]|nr:hypothetical protein [bacterium]